MIDIQKMRRLSLTSIHQWNTKIWVFVLDLSRLLYNTWHGGAPAVVKSSNKKQFKISTHVNKTISLKLNTRIHNINEIMRHGQISQAKTIKSNSIYRFYGNKYSLVPSHLFQIFYKIIKNFLKSDMTSKTYLFNELF